MKKCGIYGIRNIFNGKWYIGQSVDIICRKCEHFADLKNSVHYNRYLQRSFLKYGRNSFEFHVLEETPEDMLDIRERSWIAYYQSELPQFGYNLCSGGISCGRLSDETKQRISIAKKGHSVPEDVRRKISASLKGREMSAEVKRKISEATKGRLKRPMSDKTKAKLSALNQGHPVSKEARLKISNALKGRPKSEVTKVNMRIAFHRRLNNDRKTVQRVK